MRYICPYCASPLTPGDPCGCEALKIEELEAELEVTNQLLEERNRVMEAIPECPAHGGQCVPHAIDWVKERAAKVDEWKELADYNFKKMKQWDAMITELERENAELKDVVRGLWTVNERLTTELTAALDELEKCRQAAFENGRDVERTAGYGSLPY